MLRFLLEQKMAALSFLHIEEADRDETIELEIYSYSLKTMNRKTTICNYNDSGLDAIARGGGHQSYWSTFLPKSLAFFISLFL